MDIGLPLRRWRAPIRVPPNLRSASASRAGALIAFAIVLLVGGYLRFYRLGDGGLGNPFYAAAVRSMLHSLHNFFFVSFDPAGTFSIDKPPVALWLESLAALVFGYRGFALILPEALAGVGAIFVLYLVVDTEYGPLTALCAAAVLAVLPASVLISRNNTMDTLVMFTGLLALASVARAVRTGRRRWLLLAAILLGVAFNTKGFEGLIVAPGLVLFYLLATAEPWRRRLLSLAACAVLFLGVALAWTVSVALTPSGNRPLLLNSDRDSIWSLTFRYNGIDRLTGASGFNPGNAQASPTPGIIPTGVLYGGSSGPLRLFNEFPGPLVSGLLPAALAGALLLLTDLLDRRRRAAAAFWLLWAVAGVVAFSASRLGSPQYLESFSPALAALAAVAACQFMRGSGWRRLAGLAGVTASAAYALARLSHLGGDAEIIRALSIAAIVLLGLTALGYALPGLRQSTALTLIGGLGLLAGAGVLAVISFQAVHDAPVEGILPGVVILSEDSSRSLRLEPSLPAYYWLDGRIDYLARPLDYLRENQGASKYLVAVTTFYAASPIIAQQDAPVLPLYSEFRERPELPVDVLKSDLDSGALRYVMVSVPRLQLLYPDAASLLRQRCQNVSAAARLSPLTGMQLLHCS